MSLQLIFVVQGLRAYLKSNLSVTTVKKTVLTDLQSVNSITCKEEVTHQVYVKENREMIFSHNPKLMLSNGKYIYS